MGPGARVLFDGIPATLLYTSSVQINAIVPYAIDGRPSVQAVVDYNGAVTAPLTLQVAGSAPGIYSLDGSGSGPGAILNQDLSLNSAANPAAQGSIVILFGTGEGQTTPLGVDGQVAVSTFPTPVLPVSVTAGGRPVTEVLYFGGAPGEVAGLFQLNFRLPAGLAPGNIPVVVQVGTASSQTGLTLAVR